MQGTKKRFARGAKGTRILIAQTEDKVKLWKSNPSRIGLRLLHLMQKYGKKSGFL
jgi:hypothetical protein